MITKIVKRILQGGVNYLVDINEEVDGAKFICYELGKATDTVTLNGLEVTIHELSDCNITYGKKGIRTPFYDIEGVMTVEVDGEFFIERPIYCDGILLKDTNNVVKVYDLATSKIESVTLSSDDQCAIIDAMNKKGWHYYDGRIFVNSDATLTAISKLLSKLISGDSQDVIEIVREIKYNGKTLLVGKDTTLGKTIEWKFGKPAYVENIIGEPNVIIYKEVDVKVIDMAKHVGIRTPTPVYGIPFEIYETEPDYFTFTKDHYVDGKCVLCTDKFVDSFDISDGITSTISIVDITRENISDLNRKDWCFTGDAILTSTRSQLYRGDNGFTVITPSCETVEIPNYLLGI